MQARGQLAGVSRRMNHPRRGALKNTQLPDLRSDAGDHLKRACTRADHPNP